jgi:hypothetical protein
VGLWKNAAIKDAFRKDFHSSSIIEETSESDKYGTDSEQTSVSQGSGAVTTSVTSSGKSQQSKNIPAVTETSKDEHTVFTVPNSENISSTETDSSALQNSQNDPVATAPNYGDKNISESTSAVWQTNTSIQITDNTVTDVQTSYLQPVTSTKEIITPVELDTDTTNAGTEIMTFTSTEQPKTTAMDMTMPVTENSSSTGEAMGESTAFFMLNGIGYTYTGIRLENKYVGPFYCEIPFSYETAKTYMINGVSEEAALAVEFGGNGIYCIYRNKQYKPDSLKNMINDFSCNNRISKGNVVCDVWGERYRYNYIFTDKLLNILLKYSVLPSDTAPKRLERDYFDLTAYHQILKNNFRVFISGNGYIYVELYDWRANFYIGSDEAYSLIERMLTAVKSGYG